MFQKISLSLASILLLTAGRSLAVDSLQRRYPAVVLVQLSAEQNRMASMKKARDYKRLELLIADAKKTQTATINDFKDNFNYCPVYYYMDTNMDAVKEKRFDGILFDATGTTIEHPLINQSSKDYVIVYYGYPNMQYRKRVTATDEAQTSLARGIIIMNDEYKQIAYDVDPDYLSLSVRGANRIKKYSYISKNFNIQYLPYARFVINDLFERTDAINRLKEHPVTRKESQQDVMHDGSLFPDGGGPPKGVTPTGVTPDYNESKRNTPPKEH